MFIFINTESFALTIHETSSRLDFLIKLKSRSQILKHPRHEIRIEGVCGRFYKCHATSFTLRMFLTTQKRVVVGSFAPGAFSVFEPGKYRGTFLVD